MEFCFPDDIWREIKAWVREFDDFEWRETVSRRQIMNQMNRRAAYHRSTLCFRISTYVYELCTSHNAHWCWCTAREGTSAAWIRDTIKERRRTARMRLEDKHQC